MSGTSSMTAGLCSSLSIAPLSFRSIVPGRAGVTIKSSTTISVYCSRGTRFALFINEGSRSTGNSGAGRLSFPGGAGSLTFDLFRDSARTTPWGNATDGAGIYGYGEGVVQQFPVYASFYVRPTATIGSHTDLLTVTMSVF